MVKSIVSQFQTLSSKFIQIGRPENKDRSIILNDLHVKGIGHDFGALEVRMMFSIRSSL